MNTARKIMLALATIATLFVSGCAQLDTMILGEEKVAIYKKDVPTPPPVVVQTPVPVLMYNAFASYNRATINATVNIMEKVSMKPLGATGKLVFSSAGMTYSMEAISYFRFPVRQSVIDSNSVDAKNALEPLMATLGARLAEWNRTEPIELTVVSQTAAGADYLAAQMARTAPGLKVTKKIGTVAEAGFSGIELRMIDGNLNRQVAAN